MDFLIYTKPVSNNNQLQIDQLSTTQLRVIKNSYIKHMYKPGDGRFSNQKYLQKTSSKGKSKNGVVHKITTR